MVRCNLAPTSTLQASLGNSTIFTLEYSKFVFRDHKLTQLVFRDYQLKPKQAYQKAPNPFPGRITTLYKFHYNETQTTQTLELRKFYNTKGAP